MACALHRRPTLVAFVLVMGAAACDVLAPATPTPEPPTPGFVLGRPFPDIRALLDVVVTGVDEKRITRAVAVGTDGAIIRWDGATWTDESLAIAEDIESISGVAFGEGDEHVEVLMAVGENGLVLMRTEGVDDVTDGRWAVVPSPVTDHLFGVWVRSPDDAFIVGNNGVVLRWDGTSVVQLVDEVQIDTGAVDENGAPVIFPISDPLKSVMGNGPDDVWTVGPRGVIYHFDGDAFRRDDSQTNRTLVDVFTRAGLWIATTDGVLLLRTDEGWNDEAFVTPAPVFLQGVWTRGGNDVFAVGLAEEMFHFTEGVWNIVSLEEGSQLRAIDGAELPRPVDAGDDFVPLREFIAVGAGGRIVRGPAVLPVEGEVFATSRPFEPVEE